jgi:hypothetical protein
MADGAAALTRDAALRWIAAGGVVLIVLIRVTGQCVREWLRLRMVRDLVMGGVLDRIKVVGGLHGCSIEIRPDDSARWPRRSADPQRLDRSSDRVSTTVVAGRAQPQPTAAKDPRSIG